MAEQKSAERPVERLPAEEEHAQRAASWLHDAVGVELPVDLLVLALTHRSYAYEHGGLPNNERLEHLGDSVLGVVVTDGFFHRHPDMPEGQLAKLRAAVVNMTALAGVARGIGDGGIGPHLLLGRGEQINGGRNRDSILADTLEALIGAVHVGCGRDTAWEVVSRLFDSLMTEVATRGDALDWKTALQERSAASGLGAPVYNIEVEGPDHSKTFTATVMVGGAACGRGTGRTKKAAEQGAAMIAHGSLSTKGGDATLADRPGHVCWTDLFGTTDEPRPEVRRSVVPAVR